MLVYPRFVGQGFKKIRDVLCGSHRAKIKKPDSFSGVGRVFSCVKRVGTKVCYLASIMVTVPLTVYSKLSEALTSSMV